ncbi:adenine-specific DNA-methyltransferase [Laceyella sediminis]|jgi:adenine-specific DNA-methyltransferase|uniref:Adenine-specific DNA-methyltransferase n=1 Tax=Laceyella sediminis TaxID=573074 RepID=A0ABX5ERI1_9BACL|nr:DNA adenine methylase [Laceyella sediminis]PRZ16337.1 adenine-specific DNA-methyltransferase [Laceyella sediminis]
MTATNKLDLSSYYRLNYDEDVPHIIKYMGSKRNLMGFVVEGISEVYKGGVVCDLFAGSSVLAGALRDQVPILSNDIQEYSAVLAKTYLGDYKWSDNTTLIEDVVSKASEIVKQFKQSYPYLYFDYDRPFTLDEFIKLEEEQRQLVNEDFSKFPYHLFTKNYSGRYWSYDQCVWIDSIRAVADDYKGTPYYYAIISSLMFAMSYNSQSTGHYAQYRDATSVASMNDILIYRRKEILPFFIRKMEEFKQKFGRNQLKHVIVSMDYRDCLDILPSGATVYADPPYCFVHYSRFYHAIETLVKYDYPEVKYKGRYRTDRHQSPFCIRTQVAGAFEAMFSKIKQKEANLVLSYSNTGMIDLEKLLKLSQKILGSAYQIDVRLLDYQHSTMGRREDKSRDVKECLVIAKTQ